MDNFQSEAWTFFSKSTQRENFPLFAFTGNQYLKENLLDIERENLKTKEAESEGDLWAIEGAFI